MSLLVFVYGTLRAGEWNDINRLSPRPEFVGSGSVRGRMVDFGRYPGLLLDPAGPTAVGEIYRIAEELLPTLDEIEEVFPGAESEYRRLEVGVVTDRGVAQCLIYEVNARYRERLEKVGMRFCGLSPDGLLPETIEYRDHPWFIGVQYHPELKSRPFDPHPLFKSFIHAAVEQSRLV